MKNELSRFYGGLLGSFIAVSASAQSSNSITADYRNQMYVPAPNIAGVDNARLQAGAVTLFSGNIGAPGASDTPHSGNLFLVQSIIGAPLSPTAPANFVKFGEEIVPPAGADLTRIPSWTPQWNLYYSQDLQRLIAADIGYVKVTWTMMDGSSKENSLFVSPEPARTPVALFHTHDSGYNLTNRPPVPSDLQDLKVTLPSGTSLEWIWNASVPFNSNNPAVTNNDARELLAHSVNGLIAAVVRENGVFRGIELVSVRPVAYELQETPREIGSQLLPYNVFTNQVAKVRRGVQQDTALSFIYQHGKEGSAQYNQVYAIKKSLSPTGEDLEVLWKHKSLGQIDWPYELRRYRADWPSDPAHYQRYVRGSAEVSGPDVALPGSLQAAPMPYREAVAPTTDYRAEISGNRLLTAGAGWTLLRYLPQDGSVRFLVVRSVLHDDASQLGDLSPKPWSIGAEITDADHRGPRPGFVYAPEGNRYDWEIYDDSGDKGADWQADWTTKQIFAVNTGLLEVWWSTVDGDGIQWPSFVRRYQTIWPSAPERITIASTQGSGPIDETQERNARLYVQNDPNKAGFNPNDEHALLEPANRLDGQSASGRSVYALRDDLGTADTSLPYVLLKSRDVDGRWRFHVYQVVAEDTAYRFSYGPLVAGQLLQPPYPLNLLQLAPESYGVAGPYWKDRKQSFWAKSAGDDDGATNVVLRLFYPLQPGFYFPASSYAQFPKGVTPTNLPPAGSRFPWLNQRLGHPAGEPTDVAYAIYWPSNPPHLNVGETILGARKGLPTITNQTSVEIVYDQGLLRVSQPSVQLIDPVRSITLTAIDLSSAGDLKTAVENGVTRFVELPPQLRSRLGYDATQKTLTFEGAIKTEAAGEPYLLLNVLSAREIELLGSLSTAAAWRSAMTQLANAASKAVQVPPNTPFAGLALTAGNARSAGWVTLALGNSTNLTPVADPISLSVFRVDCPRYVGELKAILSEGPLDEKITLRHSGDFAGLADRYQFEWRTLPPDTSGQAPIGVPRSQWNSYSARVASGFSEGQGAVDITIAGPGLFTLSDNWFVCRYRPIQPDGLCADWSDWTDPQLAPGWIKRVTQAINPFDQRLADYANHGVDTIVSMIGQAGGRYRGDIAFNNAALEDFGLIEIYESVLKRGIGFSIDAGLNYGPANDALLLAAGHISDLYSLLGNEAYADACDPTIAYGTEGQYGAEATSIHCFMNQTASLLEEELALLRGRDDRLQPPVTTYPLYNRLIWNFTSGEGEVAYQQNYNIRDQNQDGKIDEADARKLYPQAHGDAWGHYLTALQGYYVLLRHPLFDWTPRSEAVLVGGVPVSVDFFDERKFASAAAAKARTGVEIVGLTYRSSFSEDPAMQGNGYPDTDPDRAWGLCEWGSRAGMGAYFDWVVGNAILPSSSAKTGIEKIDRTTVIDLREISSSYDDIQAKLDNADQGLNPLGLPKNVLPFDIDPSLVLNPQSGSVAKTHFEQIFDRAVLAMNNAIAVFNHANNCSQLLRRQADSLNEFQKNVTDREADLNNRLIESFGYPYPDDIGAGKTYAQGYDGPDLYHYMYVDRSSLTGETNGPTQEFALSVVDVAASAAGVLTTITNIVKYHVAAGGAALLKPQGWSSQRRAPGEIQRSLGELLQAKGRFEKAQREYDNLLAQIESQASLLQAQYQLNADEVYLMNSGMNTQESLNAAIRRSRESQLEFQTKARMANIVANAVSEGLPKSFGIIVGMAGGTIADFTSGLRSAIQLAGTVVSEIATRDASRESLVELDQQQAKEAVSAANNLQLTTLRQELGIQQQLEQMSQLIRQEATMRLELYTTQEAIAQAAGAYQAALARGERLLEDRIRFRREAGAEIQTRRYNDMTFRVFRNEALQKYRAQFDMAALYVYLAARAYDFETNLRPYDQGGPGQEFMSQIVRARTIGLIADAQPQTGNLGDSGLADPMARMRNNFQVLKGQLGFLNPQQNRRDFSLRGQFFRVLPTNGPANAAKAWRSTLASLVVSNILDIPEFRKYALFEASKPFEPGIVIPFSTTIDQDLNFFGWPAGPGDSSFSPTAFSTKVRTVGVSFSNFKISGSGGMRETVYAYLIPVGSDILRSPRATSTDSINYTRDWRVQDEWLPLPFKLSGKSDPRLASASFIPLFDLQGGNQLGQVRGHAGFQAYHDSLTVSRDEPDFQATQLIGRSVWNSRWLLVIPANSLLSDRDEGLQRFIYGGLVNGQRDNDGVTDIRIQFRTYSYSGR